MAQRGDHVDIEIDYPDIFLRLEVRYYPYQGWTAEVYVRGAGVMRDRVSMAKGDTREDAERDACLKAIQKLGALRDGVEKFLQVEGWV